MNIYELHPSTSGDAASPPTLARVERPTPTPGPNRILVRVRAVSLNYRDLIIAQNPRQATPRVPLSDGAGEVVALGAGVTRFAVGDRVAGTFFQNWDAGPIVAAVHDFALGGSIDGMFAEQVALPETAAVRLPDYLSYEEGATLPCAAVTAWNAMFETGNVQAGHTVLLLGTGGVSLFGVQFAKMTGARVIITSSSDEKLARAKDEFGADETVNYRTNPDWQKAVWAMTGKVGVDHILEVGGAGTLEKSLQSVRYGGTISQIGVLTGFAGQINPANILQRSVRLQGIYVGSRDMFERMNRALDQAKLHPVIDRVFGFDDASAAYDYQRSGAHFGKVVIKVGVE